MNKKMNKTPEIDKEMPTSGNKVDIVARELKFAQMLAGNDVKVRNGVLKSLKFWLTTRSQSSFPFTNTDFLRLWKGLYYCMWMSDKPLVQEDLAEDLGNLIHCFPDVQVGIQFFRAFMETMCIEWFGIDQWRIDKFMMLIRRVTRQMLIALRNSDWQDEPLKKYAEALEASVLQTNKCPKGLVMHVCDFYIEEIAKVSDGELSEERVFALLEPFLLFYTKQNDVLLLNHVKKTIFYQLLFQSELGQEFEEKFDIWKRANFPTRSIDDIEVNYKVQKNKNDEDLSDGEEGDEEERALDPRAGRVNVQLSEVKFDALKFAETMENFRYKATATSKSRKGLNNMALKFRQFAQDVFPLGVQTMPQERDEDDSDVDLDLKAMELAEFEKKLAIGGESGDSDVDDDLDNRKNGKLKRKNKELITKSKEKKQKLSKLHNSRFLNDAMDKKKEDFTKDDTSVPDDDEETPTLIDMKIKKKKKKVADTVVPTTEPRKIKMKKEQKRKSLPAIKLSEKLSTSTSNGFIESPNDDVEASFSGEKPKKAMKVTKDSTPSQQQQSKKSQPFAVNDEWSEEPKDGEVEFFVPSRKQKLKELQEKANKEESSLTTPGKTLVRNPFAKTAGSSPQVSAKKMKDKSGLQKTPKQAATPAVVASGSTGKRVVIALSKNIAQSTNEYRQQMLDSPNVPFDSNKKPTKSLLKPNAIPSPINPFYQKKIGLKLNFNESM
ncbi:unnamed protein product [Diamesa serratosioi]